MNWQHAEMLGWEHPLSFAKRFAGDDMALLYSGLREQNTGDFSYLFWGECEVVSGRIWDELPPLSGDENLPVWVGYLGYGMREEDARGEISPVTLPDFRFVRYARLWRFDHQRQVVDAFEAHHTPSSPPEGEPNHFFNDLVGGKVMKHPPHGFARANPAPPQGGSWEFAAPLSSNLTRTEYETIVAETVEQIRAGNFYQANITRKFFGEFSKTPERFALFEKLCEVSPAPYSAYVRHGDTAILSSSPELFLSIDAKGVMTTRPIKGSARRVAEETEDTNIRDALAASEKNRAENLMIVDLMRNDLARVAEPQSVKVTEQSGLYSYATIHHLISTIRAQKRAGVNAYDAVRACFPAGSMTGAPKIAAMRWCSAKEKLERGVYSGAIGWFGGNDTCDLSVVIRTLILDGNRFEFQVGGGIVADSTPEDEWRETITKARGILAALGLSEADLEKL